MVMYLRTNKDEVLLDVEIWEIKTEEGKTVVEMSTSIPIENYSKFLLANLDKQKKIIKDFEYLSELRGWLWERYFMIDKNRNINLSDIRERLEIILGKVAKDYDLKVIQD